MHNLRRPSLFGADVQLSPWVFLWHELRVGIPICVGVALFITTVFHDPFALNLVYSLCIGLTIQGLIEGGRYTMAWRIKRRRMLQGSELGAAEYHWPGWHVMAPWVVISAVLGYLFGSLLAGALTDTHHLRDILGGNLRPLAVIAVVVLAVSAGTTFSFYTRGRLAAIEAQVEAARRSAAENQLMLLQAQLEPHMLFNTLANLRVLIGVDTVQAQAMLDRLIGFLRCTLSASRVASHPLADEFARCADYLALMQVRMGPRLQVRLDLPPELAALPVPPLLLQPLVENAVLHGLEPKVEGGRIELQARADGTDLVLKVRDTGAGLAAPPTGTRGAGSIGTGFGLHQVRERLRTLHGDRASLVIAPANDAEGGTEATLRLPRPTPAAPTSAPPLRAHCP